MRHAAGQCQRDGFDLFAAVSFFSDLTARCRRSFFTGDIGVIETAIRLLQQIKNRLVEHQLGDFEAAAQQG